MYRELERSRSTTRFEVGDIIFVPRYLGLTSEHRFQHYNHAGVVVAVSENGEILEVIDFDPCFDGTTTASASEIVVGVVGEPRLLSGADQVGAVYDNSTKVEHRCSPDRRAEVVRTARGKLGQKLVYKLPIYNCQHFAYEIVTGKPYSPEVDLAARALGSGLDTAFRCTSHFATSVAPRMLAYQPFDQNSWLGWLGNGAISLMAIILIVIIIIVIFLLVF